MTGLRLVGLVAAALVLQAALVQFWHDAARWVDLLLVPLVVAASVASPRTALLVGCVSGLLVDAWFGLGAFGLNGFKRTLIAVGLSGLSTRVDLGHAGGRFAAGVLAVLADGLLDLALRPLLDLHGPGGGILPFAARAATVALLASMSGTIIERAGPRPGRRRP